MVLHLYSNLQPSTHEQCRGLRHLLTNIAVSLEHIAAGQQHCRRTLHRQPPCSRLPGWQGLNRGCLLLLPLTQPVPI